MSLRGARPRADPRQTHNPGPEMARRRKSDRSVPPLVVTTDDGKRWRCSLSTIGREAEPRWVLIDTDGVQYVGPVVLTDKSPETVRRLVSEWWTAKKGSEPNRT
jgi:hypothetical protein